MSPLPTLRTFLLLLLCSSPILSRPVDPTIPGPDVVGSPSMPSGYSVLLFQDDFSGQPAGSPPSRANWVVDTGTAYPGGPAQWGNGESQTYTLDPANLRITEGGQLAITPVGGGSGGAAGGWTSARIETRPEHDFSCAPGGRLRIEGRIRLGASPAAQLAGIWPAFWSLGAAYRGNYRNWPSVGEIDLLENVNGAATAWHTIHCGSTARGGPCRETNGIGGTAPLARGAWHTVAVEMDRSNQGGDWRDESIAWEVDGVRTLTVKGRDVADAQAWASLVHEPRFIILNVAVGGSFPDAVAGPAGKTPNSATRGGEDAGMQVGWVGVYST